MPPHAKWEFVTVHGSADRYAPALCKVCLSVHTGEVKVKVSAEAMKTNELCGNEVVTVPEVGQIDTVVRPLLVEVCV